MKRLHSHNALITGAAQGIGYGIAKRFAAEGANLLLVDLSADKLEAVSAELSALGIGVETLTADLTVPETTQAIADLGESMGGLDILVNNAGIGGAGTIEEFDQEGWDRLMAINLTAPYRITRAVLPQMTAKNYGRVINISSMNGLIGMRRDAVYSATKSGLHALTRSVAVDYGRMGITSNAIAPGPIRTPLNAQVMGGQPSWFMRTVVDNKPVHGWGAPEDIGATAAFLASDDARFISGQIIAVDGGLSATRFVPDEPEY